MKAKYVNGYGKRVAYINVEIEVDIDLIRKAIIYLLDDGTKPTKKAILDEMKSISMEFGQYGYGETINENSIPNYYEYLEIANQKIAKYFPDFLQG
jgi:hypothetical protein